MSLDLPSVRCISTLPTAHEPVKRPMFAPLEPSESPIGQPAPTILASATPARADRRASAQLMEGGSPPRPGQTRQRPPRRTVTVDSVSAVTANLVRVVVSGELAGWDAGGPGGHLKIFLPQAQGDPVMRTYTVRRFDADAGELTLEFVIHGHGPASSWASAAAPGGRFAVAGQARSGFRPSEGARWCLLAGDQSALPAIAAVADALPPGFPAHAVVEVPGPADEISLDSPSDLRATWLVADRLPCEELVSAVTDLDLPDGPGDVWVGCEATAMRRIRAHLLQDRGLPHLALHTRAYWKVDVADHSDHDTGAEDDPVPDAAAR